MKNWILSLLFVMALAGLKAGETPQELLQAFMEKTLQVNDYKAKVNIKVEVDFIKIKERKAVVLFEQPNTFKFSTGGFALLPKKGVDMEYISLLQDDYTAIDAETETVQEVETRIIKVIPSNDDKDIVLAKMYIHEESKRLYRMESYTKQSGTYTVDFFYADHPYDLPDKLKVSFDVKNQKLPVSLTGDLESVGRELEKENARGVVILNYSDYQVNRKTD